MILETLPTCLTPRLEDHFHNLHSVVPDAKLGSSYRGKIFINSHLKMFPIKQKWLHRIIFCVRGILHVVQINCNKRYQKWRNILVLALTNRTTISWSMRTEPSRGTESTSWSSWRQVCRRPYSRDCCCCACSDWPSSGDFISPVLHYAKIPMK